MIFKNAFVRRSVVLLGILALSGVVAFFVVDEIKGGAVGAGQVKVDIIVEPGDSPVEVTENLSKNGLLKSSKYSFFNKGDQICRKDQSRPIRDQRRNGRT